MTIARHCSMESYSRPFPFWSCLSGDSLVRQCNYQSGPYRKIGTNRWPNKIRIKATLAAVQTFSGSFTTLAPPARGEIIKIILSMRKRTKQARLEVTINGEDHTSKRTLNTNGMLWLEMKSCAIKWYMWAVQNNEEYFAWSTKIGVFTSNTMKMIQCSVFTSMTNFPFLEMWIAESPLSLPLSVTFSPSLVHEI